jgi:hypothetical protein
VRTTKRRSAEERELKYMSILCGGGVGLVACGSGRKKVGVYMEVGSECVGDVAPKDARFHTVRVCVTGNGRIGFSEVCGYRTVS